MERPNVPKFGDWNKTKDATPYTIYFDKARKGRGGRKMINPNDPEENPDLFEDNSSDQSRSTHQESIDETPTHQRRGSNSSTPPTKLTAGSEGSFERSPLHPQYRGKAAGGIVAGVSPARDINKSPLHGSQGNRTTARPRMKPTSKDNGIPERGGATIPPFWDEKNTDSSENYTEIFDTASKERQTGSSNAPNANSNPSYYNNPKQKTADKGCCFGLFRK